ncbi:hypothetical protein N7533_008823 [Penicillium manginii]|uniref:uncharacterized protein n=1 Tax=Penicillium manginii TaxID=203109 RepID=UPI0025483DF1|nr:uncharacterized protein N7533_008823 [Penicillium manginii]KAJ5743953.1 hypothetical protein N7533_008823 [Penicillium manginii]
MATSVTCLCGGVKQSIQLDPDADHSLLQLCHCTNCRAITGLLGASYYLMQDGPVNLDGLQIYSESPHVSRFFCRNCGAHIFARLASSGRYLVASGVVVATDTLPVKSVQHWQTEDTGDGGLSTFLPGWPSRERCALQAGFEQLSRENVNTNNTSQDTLTISPHRDELHGQCHCGGIRFYVTSPDISSSQAWSPWPDLLVPYHSESSENINDVKWWLSDGDTKYLAGTCACTSCRLGSGFPIQTWAFIPRSNLFNDDRSPLSFDRGTMQRYESSPGVYREFCNRCGANVFWHNTGRPTIIDVSVGLLRGEGARVEGWLKWATGRVSFTELAVQKDLVGLLEKGLQEYHRSPSQAEIDKMFK